MGSIINHAINPIQQVKDLVGGVKDVAGIKDVKVDKEQFKDPYSGELRTRLLGIIDKYIKEKGIDALIPKENRPYEYLTDEERAEVMQHKAELAEQGQTEGNRQKDGGRYYYPGAPIGTVGPGKPEEVSGEEAPDAEDPKDSQPASLLAQKYARAGLAARLQSQRAGLDPTGLSLVPPKALATQNQAQQGQQLEDLMNYIRLGRRARGF